MKNNKKEIGLSVYKLLPNVQVSLINDVVSDSKIGGAFSQLGLVINEATKDLGISNSIGGMAGCLIRKPISKDKLKLLTGVCHNNSFSIQLEKIIGFKLSDVDPNILKECSGLTKNKSLDNKNKPLCSHWLLRAPSFDIPENIINEKIKERQTFFRGRILLKINED